MVAIVRLIHIYNVIGDIEFSHQCFMSVNWTTFICFYLFTKCKNCVNFVMEIKYGPSFLIYHDVVVCTN